MRSEKRKEKSEKLEVRSEKREERSENRKAKSEKLGVQQKAIRGTEKEEGRARAARRNRRRDGGTGPVPGEDGQYLLLGRRNTLATIFCRLSGLAHHLRPSHHNLNEQFFSSQ